MRRLSPLLLAATLLSPASAQDDEALPLSRVVLFTSGVGYYQRDGSVTGDASVELRFPVDDVNDLLKSLVLRDLDGGTISRVTYASREPLERALGSFTIDLSGNPSLAQLLQQARGERVAIAAPTPLEGVVVGVEVRTVREEDDVVQMPVLNLLTAEGLKSVVLERVQHVRFLREEVQQELHRALGLIAGARDTESVPVSLRFSGEGERRVRAAYITAAPVWKTTYRLVLDDTPFLQAWAIVENASDTDWDGVDLTLVSGRPVSFIMDLYEPLYLDRPEVELELHRSLRPQRYAEAILEAEETMDAGAERRRGFVGGRAAAPGAARAEAAKALDLDEGVQAAAAGAEVGELFSYEIEEPVHLARRTSALIPIAQTALEGRKLVVYNASAHVKHPLNGVRLKNTSDLHFMDGPVTVFDGGVYAGDALLGDLRPGGERLMTYALALDVEVEPASQGLPERIVEVRLVRGALVVTRRLRQETRYHVRNRSGEAKLVLIEHPYHAAWELVEPAESKERTRDLYRFELDVPAEAAATLPVVTTRTVEQSVSLSATALDALEYYLRVREIGPDVRQTLERVIQIRREIHDLETALRRVDQRTKAIFDDQGRIRENLNRVPRDSDLHARYVQTLAAQEDELARLEDERQRLTQTLTTRRSSLEDVLRTAGGDATR